MAHLHSVYDTDQHFKIDAITREIINQAERKNKLMQFDHNSERFTFELPRYVDGHDMTLSNQIRIHYINAGSARQQSKDVYPVYDMQLSPNDSKTVIFSWLISQNATKYAGTLNFLVEFSCVDGEGIVEYTWHTEIFKGITISTGMSNTENLVVQVSDVVAQWEQELFGVGDSVIANIEDTKNAVVSAVEAKGAETLATIPDDYNKLYGMANDAIRTRANAIVSKVEGEAVTASDCSGDYLRGLRIFGKSTQDGTSTPDAPVDIVSVENAGIIIKGKNLVNLTCYSGSENYKSLVNAYDLRAIKKGRQYTLSVYLDAESDTRAYWNNAAKLFPYLEFDVQSGLHRYTYTFTAMKDGMVVKEGSNMVNKFPKSDSVNIVVTNAQIEESATATDYESYTEQTMTIPHTLSGVPVSSGGNYTDANGQQWICDEVDLERGVYVQRIATVTFSGEEDWYLSATQIDSGTRFDCNITTAPVALVSDSLCNRFQYRGANAAVETAWILQESQGFRIITEKASTVEELKVFLAINPTTMVYAMYTPIETALTDEEIFNFSQLHSNYPNTTILNDVGAWMEVAYNADTELYFNNSRGATDEQVDKSVDAWLTAHFTDAEEVSF